MCSSMFSWWMRFPWDSDKVAHLILQEHYTVGNIWEFHENTFTCNSFISSVRVCSYQKKISDLLLQCLETYRYSLLFVFTFFSCTPFKLFSSWISRFWRSLMLSPERSSPKSCLQSSEKGMWYVLSFSSHSKILLLDLYSWW